MEKRNLALFGYGVKGMVLSMIEAAVEITDARISASRPASHRRARQGRCCSIRWSCCPASARRSRRSPRDHEIVLITKGDLFHQEAKVKQSGLADLFRRIEIVSEKDAATYARVLRRIRPRAASQFAMIGNSLRSDIAPVLQLGGWGVHMPYHVTWAHEAEADVADDAPRLRRVAQASRTAGGRDATSHGAAAVA